MCLMEALSKHGNTFPQTFMEILQDINLLTINGVDKK